MKKSKTQIKEDFNEAMFQFILHNPPFQFKQVYFTILCMSGRIDEATDYLNNFGKEE